MMINTRYKKLTGIHAGRVYIVVAPYSEVENPIRWMLHCVNDGSQIQIVSEGDLSDPKLWQHFP